jgi:ATP-binding cassette subfamily B protein
MKNIKQSPKQNQQRKKPTFKPGTAKRFFKYLFNHNKKAFIFVICSILITSLATVFSSVMLQRIIDDVIKPGLSSNYDAISDLLIIYISSMISVYAISVIITFIYTRMMAKVTQSTLYNLRADMFDKMQQLPIKYYDTHPHGDIMSTYTNDTDALRQLIGQVLPQMIQSMITVIAIVVMMIGYSLSLSMLVGIVILIMLRLVKRIAGGSAKYMMKQQKSIAAEEGFIEEFIQGQKVVKVFNYEENAKEAFDVFNEQLFEDSNKANTYSNILMPIMANIGNIMYVLVAFVGGILIINQVYNISILGYNTLTVGIIVAYLTFVRTLSQTIGRISSQVGMITMGLSGASRIFELLDESPEKDDGYVVLVNYSLDKNGQIKETLKRTNKWAWKYKHQSTGITEYIELKGDIVFENVDFSYDLDKQILHDIVYMQKLDKKSHSLVQPVQVKQLLQILLIDFMIFLTEKSDMMVLILEK